jgi:hypothetical protein
MLITPALHVKHEEYWIHYVLRDLFKVFGCAVMLDTGSIDATCDIAVKTARQYGADLTLIQEQMGNDAVAIGNCPSRLREMVKTKWMLLVDGDEIWREMQLRTLIDQTNILSEQYEVVMFNGRNLTDKDGVLMERDGFVADRLFGPEVRWHLRQDYPFQSHGLEERDRAGRVFRADHTTLYFWHVRHLKRSLHDDAAYFRNHKLGYYPIVNSFDLPKDWIGEISEYPNPYLR